MPTCCSRSAPEPSTTTSPATSPGGIPGFTHTPETTPDDQPVAAQLPRFVTLSIWRDVRPGLVAAWVDLHRAELVDAWERAPATPCRLLCATTGLSCHRAARSSRTAPTASRAGVSKSGVAWMATKEA